MQGYVGVDADVVAVATICEEGVAISVFVALRVVAHLEADSVLPRALLKGDCAGVETLALATGLVDLAIAPIEGIVVAEALEFYPSRTQEPRIEKGRKLCAVEGFEEGVGVERGVLVEEGIEDVVANRVGGLVRGRCRRGWIGGKHAGARRLGIGVIEDEDFPAEDLALADRNRN